MDKISIGTGVLTWDAVERRSDRYGAVYLIDEEHNSLSPGPSPSLIHERTVRECAGRIGELIAVVKIARESTHIGDLFRGVFPSTPEVGEIVMLGCGTLFCESAPHGGICVGLLPNDGRETDWLKIEALYRAHEQTVSLYFHEVSK